MTDLQETEDIRETFGFAIFCDDIRREIGDKTSFIGAYAGVMVVHAQFPVVLPKLGIGISYFEHHGSRDEPVTLRIFFPNEIEPAIEAQLPIEEIRQTAVSQQDAVKDDNLPQTRYLRFDTQIVLNGVVLKSTGLIRVRLFCGGEMVRIGTLRI